MSLTPHLADKTSPVRQFFEEAFPDRSYLFSQIREALSGSTTVRPIHKQESLVGTALDYRLRYFLRITPSRETVAYIGGRISSRHPLLRKDQRISASLIEDIFNRIDTIVTDINPAGRMVSQREDSALNRCCVVLAYFERISRNPDVVFSSPLLNPTPVTDIATVFINADVLSDLRVLGELFYSTQEDLIAYRHTAVLNPTFAGSIDVGGADADMIVNGLLIDIKSITKPGGRLQDIYQLTGYCLLDYADEYRITSVGLYFARQAVLVTWPLEKFFFWLTAGDFDIHASRKQFRDVLRCLPRRGGD